MVEESGVEFDDILTEVLEEADTEGIEPPENRVTIAHSVNPELQGEITEDRIQWFADRFEIPSATVQMAESVYQRSTPRGAPRRRQSGTARRRLRRAPRSRFDDVQGGRGGDRGVEGVTPVFEHRDAHPRREGLAGRDDAVRGVDGRTPRLEAIEVRLHAHDTDGAGENTSARSDASDGRPGQA